MLKLLGCSRLTGLRLTPAMALPFCRQAPPSARNPQVQHDDVCHRARVALSVFISPSPSPLPKGARVKLHVPSLSKGRLGWVIVLLNYKVAIYLAIPSPIEKQLACTRNAP